MARMRIRELQLGDALRIQVVESIDVRHLSSNYGGRLLARLEPVAMIVRTAEGATAFNMAGDEIDFADLGELESTTVRVTTPVFS